jgi:hypothetical protein
MNTTCGSSIMCNVKVCTNMSSVKAIISIEDILKLMLFFHQYAMSLRKSLGPIHSHKIDINPQRHGTPICGI